MDTSYKVSCSNLEHSITYENIPDWSLYTTNYVNLSHKDTIHNLNCASTTHLQIAIMCLLYMIQNGVSKLIQVPST